MKSKNAKRIAAVAASLLMGLAFASSGASGVTYGSIPVINNQGTPVVQIVVGSGTGTQYTPWPSDGVVAANIAAVIGNLAFTSQNVTATVGNTAGVTCVVTTPSCKLTNQQVWLGESGLSTSSGSYAFYALIGSVLNGALPLNNPGSTKSLFTGTGQQYSYPEIQSLTISPVSSPYSASGQVPFTSVTGSTNGGGVSFTSGFGLGSSPVYDNLLRVTQSQLPGLLSNSGTYGENSYLWLAGFPVFNQQSGVNGFRLMSATGAYQVSFNKPIQLNGNATGKGNIMTLNAPIRLLGSNYTILKAYSTTTTTTSSNTVAGGKIELAAALTPVQTVYVGHNVTSGPFTVVLQDLGQPNTGGVSPASVAVYFNNVLTNTTSITPGTTTQFNVSGQKLFVNVQSTFAGLYAYQKWAKMQIYSNILNLTDGTIYNQTTNPGWYVRLLWTNVSSASAANAVALQSIVVYNASPTTLAPGQSFTFIQNPQKWQVKFVGDTLSASGFDSLTALAGFQPTVNYQNTGALALSGQAGSFSISNITEPVQELTVTSQIPNAFSYGGQTSSQVVYALTPYKLNELANTMGNLVNGITNAVFAPPGTDNVLLFDSAPGSAIVGTGNWISSTNPLTVTIKGYTSNTASTPVSSSVQFTTSAGTGNFFANALSTTSFFNVTAITLSRALPGNVVVEVVANSLSNTANAVQLANLTLVAGGGILYGVSNKGYQNALDTADAGSVNYNTQNGQQTTTFALTRTDKAYTANNVAGVQQYFSYAINEVAVTSNSAVSKTSFNFGIDNSTAGPAASPAFQLNYSASFSSNAVGTKNNVTYVPSGTTAQTASFNVQPGFISERGSKVVSITPTQDTFNLAKTPDQLLFVVGASNSVSTSTTTNYGPYKIGQATNIANVTIANVTASCTGGNATSASCSVTGLNNLTATPSVKQAVVPVHLNTAQNPLVVLDSNAQGSASLIVIGSKYVNSVAAQIFQQNPTLDSSFGPGSVISAQEGSSRILVAGYTANQTVQAGNQFIGQLLADAGQ